jgi:S1-C subfamily serine protease
MNNVYNSIVRIVSNNQDWDYLNPQNTTITEPTIGTGFFVGKNIIITCAHVIDTAKNIQFTIPSLSNEKYTAEIYGICLVLDIAILRSVNYLSPTYLSLSNSDNVILQDNIRVIGFPLGRDKIKVTKGIISGIQDGFIQIDSAINSGNSGGPLIDSSNNVIGIISSKVASAENIGYALPINLINIFKNISPGKKIYDICNFMAKFSNTSAKRLEYLKSVVPNIESKTGLTVSKLVDTSPLKNIGIDIGDFIFSFDNKNISNICELDVNNSSNTSSFKILITDYIERLNPGIEYNISYLSVKNKKIIHSKIVFPEMNNNIIRRILPMFEKIDYLTIGGIILCPLTINLLSTYIGYSLKKHISGMEKFKHKIVVVNILPDSPFIISENLSVGDIIDTINDQKITTFDSLLNVLKNINQKYLTITTLNGKLDTIDTDSIKKDLDSIKKDLDAIKNIN